MICQEILCSIVIGLITGGISGSIVSFFFERRTASKEQTQRFEYEKKELSQFLLHIFDELTIVEQNHDVTRLIWILGTKPFCDNLYQSENESNKSLLKEIDGIIENISIFCFSRTVNAPLDDGEKEAVSLWSNDVPKLAERTRKMSQ